MNDYIELRANVVPCTETATDLMAAFLADAGYESFVADSEGLFAYIRKEMFNAEAVNDIVNQFPIECKITTSHITVPGQDWNSEWEKHYFKPIVVGDRCVIHSSFHTDVPQAEYDIVIDPKMAFGTGHHATTSQVIEHLLALPIAGKDIIDMGTGTGILSILCAMLGAYRVTGIEIDEAAYTNAIENIQFNNVDNTVRLILGDASALRPLPQADLFIANINRNIITADINQYANHLKSGGLILLSGFYEDDIPIIMETAAPLGLVEESHTVCDRWTCLKLRKL